MEGNDRYEIQNMGSSINKESVYGREKETGG